MRWITPFACALLASCSCNQGPEGNDDDSPTDGGGTLPVVTSVTLSDNARMVLEKRFAITLGDGVTSALLVCTSPDDPLEDHRLPVSEPVGEIRLYGLLADTDYACTLSDGDTELWTGGFHTKPLPDGFPTLLVTGDADRASMDEGYVLFNHWRRGTGMDEPQRVMLIDNEGRVRWYVALLDARVGGIAARWLGDGRVLIGGGDAISPGFYDLSGDVTFEVAPAIDPDEGYHHEAALTPEGYILSLQGTEDLGPLGEEFVGYRIEATDPTTGDVMWQFNSQDGVDAGTLPVPKNGERSAFHANAVSWLNDDPEGDSVWVSMRAINRIARIDRATGEITTLFGPDLGIGLFDMADDQLDKAAWFWGEHDPVIENGNTFTVFDNGGSRPGSDKYSRAVTISLDAPDHATLQWEWTQPGWYEPDFGSVQFLADRHVVIGSGHCIDDACPPEDDAAFVLEVDPPSGKVVWRYDFSEPSDTIYRAEAVDGCAFPNVRYCPAAATR